MFMAILTPFSWCFLSSTSLGHLFHSIFCYGFLFWVQIWVVHLPRCMGVYFTTNCFGTLVWTFFPTFPSQAVECFYQVLLLDIFTVGLSFFLMLGKFACSWPFWAYFYSVDLIKHWAWTLFYSGPKSFSLWQGNSHMEATLSLFS